MDDTGQRRVPVNPPSALRQFQIVALGLDDARTILTRDMTLDDAGFVRDGLAEISPHVRFRVECGTVLSDSD